MLRINYCMSFKQLKRFLISNFLASADIKVFGHTYVRIPIFTMLFLIGLALFLHPECFCLTYHYIFGSTYKQMLLQAAEKYYMGIAIFFNFHYRVIHQYTSETLCKSFEGVQVMATINLQCNSPSQIHSSVYFRLIIV